MCIHIYIYTQTHKRARAHDIYYIKINIYPRVLFAYNHSNRSRGIIKYKDTLHYVLKEILFALKFQICDFFNVTYEIKFKK